MFGDRLIIPFSEAYDSMKGECLEKAILIQLAAQVVKYPSFLINGCLAQDCDVGVSYHAFNVVFRKGNPFLIDSQNPLRVANGKVTHPYIAPIEDLSGGDCEFIVPREWKQGRTYSIF